jgi:putative membrane protein
MAMPPLTDADRAAIGAAVTQAETHSSGEIVTVLSPIADGYWDVALAWSAFVALLALAVLDMAPAFYLGLVDRLLGRWGEAWTPRDVLSLALTVATLKFAGMVVLQLWRPLRLWLVPNPIKAARVHARAVTAFKLGAEQRSAGRTGVLVYLSLAEHRAVILADAAIASKVSPDVWGDAMHALLGPIRQGRVADGMVAAIGKVGTVLAEHLPPRTANTNDIPDRLIEV